MLQMPTMFGFFLMAFTPISAHAEEGVTRREGYLLIWESIRRPAYETIHVDPYEDVPKGAEGELEITFGKRRGILDKQATKFYPDDPLSRHDALLWMYRTRNIDELPNMQMSDMWEMHQRYPITELDAGAMITSREELFTMMQALDKLLFEEVHEVSYYADDFHGQGTAFGEVFDMHAITAAHRSFPQDTLVKVTNIANGKSVVVRINDRGPYVHGRNMDLSLAAFEKISPLSTGIIKAKFHRLGDVDAVSGCTDRQRIYQKRITRDVRFHRGVPHTYDMGRQLALGSTKWFVVRGITYPDGRYVRLQDYIAPEERFLFVPSLSGKYTFHVGTKHGHLREMTMNVLQCSSGR